jgi:hypothetical protein
VLFNRLTEQRTVAKPPIGGPEIATETQPRADGRVTLRLLTVLAR